MLLVKVCRAGPDTGVQSRPRYRTEQAQVKVCRAGPGKGVQSRPRYRTEQAQVQDRARPDTGQSRPR